MSDNSKFIVAVAGYPKSGKDMLANNLINIHPIFKKEKFVYTIIDIVAILLNIYKSDLTHTELFEDREWKENHKVTFGEKTYTIRKLLQLIGTECFRDIISPDVWVSTLDTRIGSYSITTPIIITDLRFQNEYEYIRSKGGLVVFVDNPMARNEALSSDVFAHRSESYIEQLGGLADIVLDNSSSLETYQDFCIRTSKYINREYRNKCGYQAA